MPHRPIIPVWKNERMITMTVAEAMQARHSVRSYKDTPLGAEVISAMQKEIDACNKESGLHIQMAVDEPKAFDSFMAHYGKFSGVRNYIALIGKKGADLDEKLGYYGERLVLLAQRLGLNTCWVAMTFGKNAAKSCCTIAPGEKLVCVLSLGYGATQGTSAQEQIYGRALSHRRRHAGMVPQRHGSSHAGSYSDESAEIFDFSPWQ